MKNINKKVTRNNAEYSINYEKMTIIISKRFAKQASQFDTAEFKLMKRLREEFSGFTFTYKSINKNSEKQTYKGLSMDEMKRFIDGRSDKEKDTFSKACKLAESRKQGKYAVVKKWFLKNYKEAYNSEIDSLNAELDSIEEELTQEENAAAGAAA